MRRARVVHVVVAGEIGGAERMLVDLATRPAASDADHVVALFTPNPALRAVFVDAGLRLHDRGEVREDPVAFLRRSLGRRDVAWLADVLATERADIAHLHTFGSQVLGTRAARRAGARVVRTEHSTRVYDDPSCWPFSRWSLARSDAVVAISAHVAGVCAARAPWVAPHLHVVKNGVDTRKFAPPDPAATDAGAPRPAAEAVHFVLVGRLEPRKGVDIALDALARVPGARLDIVGDGESRATLVRHAAAAGVSGRVRFHGYVADPRPLLADADAALSASRAEGLGIALLEAMAMGLPVVAVPVGGIPEIVRDGETGWLARAASAEALAEGMQRVVADRAEARERGRRARAFVEGTASIEAMAAGYGAVYRPLLSRA